MNNFAEFGQPERKLPEEEITFFSEGEKPTFRGDLGYSKTVPLNQGNAQLEFLKYKRDQAHEYADSEIYIITEDEGISSLRMDRAIENGYYSLSFLLHGARADKEDKLRVTFKVKGRPEELQAYFFIAQYFGRQDPPIHNIVGLESTEWKSKLNDQIEGLMIDPRTNFHKLTFKLIEQQGGEAN